MSTWNGLTANGGPISITPKAMADWAYSNEQQMSILWGCKKQFTPDEVVSPELKGARFVYLAPGEKTYAEAAERAGWPDMAARFKEAGL